MVRSASSTGVSCRLRRHRDALDADEQRLEKSGMIEAMAGKEYISKELGTFLRQYGRRAQKRQEPNDRAHDRYIEKQLRRLKPED